MTFTTSLKEEISQQNLNMEESRIALESFIKFSGKIGKEIVLTMENGAVARKIYKEIKKVYDIIPLITIRNQKRFRVKQIYILTIKDKVDFIKDDIDIRYPISELTSDEEKVSFLRGAFLAVGNISNPQTSGYHLEFICSNMKLAKEVKCLLDFFNFEAKIITRGYKNVVYLKASENISDLLKLFKATNALFFFEDIRIYRDHKNMVNRLNNCEIANQEKILKTGIKQLEDIAYIKENDLLGLLDENVREAIRYREMYPETSLSELADIISQETGRTIGKSGVNHYFIKVKKLVERHKNKNEG
jgi:DNA-binding protein WhiA